MNSANPLSHLVRSESGVRVERTVPNYDHLAWSTVQKLLGRPDAFGEDRQAVTIFLALMRRVPEAVTAYVSPWSLVTAAAPDHDFLAAARSEQRAWYARLRGVFFGSAHTQKFFGVRGTKKGDKDPALRQLEYHGVLIASGRHVFPDSWPSPVGPQVRFTLVGWKFGRLTVIADLPQQRHRCRCECGNVKDADRNHLRSGRTKSCGCLARAQRAANEARRSSRGR